MERQKGISMHKHGGDLYKYPDFIDFSANINLLGAPKGVLQAVRDTVSRVIHYPQPKSELLCEKIGEMEQVNAQHVICGNGAAEVIFSLVLAEKPQKALIPIPIFQEYEQALLSVNCQVETTVLWANEEKEIENITIENRKLEAQLWEEFLGKIKEDMDMVFFCNPNNPTGILYHVDKMEQLLEKCSKTGTRLVIDECFMDFVFTPEKYTMKSALQQYPNLFIIKAFTKIFGIPGLRLGYGLSTDIMLLQKMHQVTQPWNVSVLAQEAGIAATKEMEFVTQTKEITEKEKQYLLEQLEELPVKVYGHAANFIFFQARIGLDMELKTYHILIRNCDNFKGLSKGWYRIAVRTRKENQRLIQAWKELEQQR